MNTTRLRELCDAAGKGALRDEELRELVGLAREAVDEIETAHILLDSYKVVSTSGRKPLDVGDRIERMRANS